MQKTAEELKMQQARDAQERQQYLASHVPQLSIDGLDKCEQLLQYDHVLLSSFLSASDQSSLRHCLQATTAKCAAELYAVVQHRLDGWLNPLIATLKPQNNGSSYTSSNTVIGTLAVGG